jgi:uncharacterized membrane protein
VSRTPLWIILLASVAGIASTITQIVERISLAENPGEELFCDISGTVACGGVLTAWQSRVFGIPNATIGLTVFALMLSAAIGALLGSQWSRRYRLLLLGLALFMLGFVLWFLFQSTFVIGAVCIFCVVIGLAVVLISASLLRIAVAADDLGQTGVAGFASRFVSSGDDVWLWLALVAGIGGSMWFALS